MFKTKKLALAVAISSLILTNSAFSAKQTTTPQLMAYYSNWGMYEAAIRGDNFKVGDPQFNSMAKNLNIIAYAFAEVYPDGFSAAAQKTITNSNNQIGKIYLSDPWSDLVPTDANNGNVCSQSNNNNGDSYAGSTGAQGDLYVTCFGAYAKNGTSLSAGALAGYFGFGNLSKLHTVTGPKKLLSIGGWFHENGFITGAFVNNANFVNSAIYLVKKLNLDGIDLDYEPPTGYNDTTDGANMVQLATALRQGFNSAGLSDKLITVAIFADPNKMKNFNANQGHWQQLAAQVDYIGIMGYDYHGGFDAPTNNVPNPPYTNTNFLANLDIDPADIIEQQAPTTEFSSVRAVNALKSYGVAPSKMILGYPSYGRQETGITGVNQNSPGLYLPFTAAGATGDMGNEQQSYYNIIKTYLKTGGYTQYQKVHDTGVDGNPIAAAWLFGNGLFMSYDTPDTAYVKAQYIQQNNLGGAMMWEMIGDIAPNDNTDGIGSNTGNKSLICAILNGWSKTCQQ